MLLIIIITSKFILNINYTHSRLLQRTGELKIKFIIWNFSLIIKIKYLFYSYSLCMYSNFLKIINVNYLNSKNWHNILYININEYLSLSYSLKYQVFSHIISTYFFF